jgi:hypothetical protein
MDYECKFCYKRYQHKSSLVRHLNEIHQEVSDKRNTKEYVCEICIPKPVFHRRYEFEAHSKSFNHLRKAVAVEKANETETDLFIEICIKREKLKAKIF